MNKEWLTEGGSTIAVGYLKRWLEGALYNRMGESDAMSGIHELPISARYGIEAALNLVNAVFASSFSPSSPLQRAIKEIAVDAAPEISKRLVNNDNHARSTQVAALLLKLSDEDLGLVLNWISSVPENRRRQIGKLIEKLDSEQLARLAQMSAADRDALLGTAGMVRSTPQTSTLADDLKQAREWLARKKD